MLKMTDSVPLTVDDSPRSLYPQGGYTKQGMAHALMSDAEGKQS
jgi:hypothetical protein